MTKTNDFIFTALKIIAWVIFVGLCIEAGGLIVNFIFSVFNPGIVPKLYQKLDLSAVYIQSKGVFFSMYSLILYIAVLKAYLFYLAIQLLTKLNLKNPFNNYVSKKIISISHHTFIIGIISLIGKQIAKNLGRYGYHLEGLITFWEDGQAFILMAAVIYIIGTIFKRGVEIQSENDLTI